VKEMKGTTVKALGLLAATTASLLTFPLSILAQQKKQVQPGVFMQVLRPDNSVDAAIERGRKLFNEIGCAGCHPRGGTIGGTAVDAAGNPNPIPIPDLRGAALHFPRLIAGKVVTLGQLNDL